MDLMDPAVEKVISLAKTVTFGHDTILGEQYAKCTHFYLLLEGTVGLYYEISSLEQQVQIGKASFKYAPVGLSIFNEPFRNESSYKVISREATLLRWTREQIDDLLLNDVETATAFVKFVNYHAHDLIKDATELFADLPITSHNQELPDKVADGFEYPSVIDQTDNVIFLLQCPFMEGFEESELIFLADHIIRKEYKNGDTLALQGHPIDSIRILESGEVQFARSNAHEGKRYGIVFRNISTPGYMLGSSGALLKNSILTSTVMRDSVILQIPNIAFDELTKKNPAFGLKYQCRVLWMIQNQLRAIRAKLVASEHDEEYTVICSMIDSNKSKLGLNSELHKIPYLLKGKLTVKHVFDILHEVERSGSSVEKNLASLCLDNLFQTKKELDFYNGLMKVYNSVVDCPKDMDTESIRVNCIRSTKEAYKPVSVLVKGFENLPDSAGNMVIYNHLLNDLYYTLPNNFNITQDSHYISSLLYEKYGKSSERIVRIGDSIEYGHQEYYEKLDFIGVYTIPVGSKEEARERREVLFHDLEACLADDRNIIVSPEGTSYATEQSPGPFKTGMFKMIQRMKKEPMIIPIVMVNFDKRVKNSRFACEIRKPFKLSEKMAAYGEKDINEFLIQYQKEYKEHVELLAKEVASMD